MSSPNHDFGEPPCYCSRSVCMLACTRFASRTRTFQHRKIQYYCPVTAVAQWLRFCAKNRKVAGSIPAGVSGFFIDIKCFRSHYGPGVDSASNTNEYQEYIMEVKAAGAQAWQPYHHPVPLSRNLGALTSWNPLGLSRPVTGLLYLYLFYCPVSHPH